MFTADYPVYSKPYPLPRALQTEIDKVLNTVKATKLGAIGLTA